MSLLSFKSKMFLPLHSIFFSHIILGTSLHNLECASGFCCDICKASEPAFWEPEGEEEPFHMWICLLCLFVSPCCFVLFCLFSAWLKSFLSLGSLALPGFMLNWTLRVESQNSSSPLFGIESISGIRHSLLCLPRGGTLTVFLLLLFGIQEC